MSTTQTYAAAFVQALIDTMEEDATVSLIGSAPLGLGPLRRLTENVRERFPDRVVDPPTSEAGIAALGAGAAMAGVRPVVDLTTGSFMYLAWTQLVNEAANVAYMSGGKLSCPVVYHCLEGIRGSGAPQHSQTPHAMLWNAPGLQILCPSMPADIYRLLRGALKSKNPSVIFSHAKVLAIEGPAAANKQPLPFGRADIKRRGRDVTVVAISIMVHQALAAAQKLAAEGIEIEIVDPRTLAPFDEQTMLESLARTGRLVVADEAPLQGGAASAIAGIAAERGFHLLKAPVVRVARPDVPVPYSPPLEAAITPGADHIVAAVKKTLGHP